MKWWIWPIQIIAVLLACFIVGCSTALDYAKLSNKQACGHDDCGKEP